jgi:signal transduction histidine kinase
MSLRARLLLVLVVLNAAVVGAVQLGASWVHRGRADEQREVYRGLLQSLLADADSPEEVNARWVARLLELDSLPQVFRDVVVTSGWPAKTVDLNPLGAVHRDRDSFPEAAVRDGIREAMARASAARDGPHSGPPQPVPVGEGFCIAIRAGDRVAAGAWFVPREQQPTLPVGFIAVPVLVSTVLFAALAFYALQRSILQPLQRLGQAAARVGAGEYGVRVQDVAEPRELRVLVEAFNSMTAKVAGHTDELRREVARATEEAARRERALVVSSRLASIGTLAAGIAHEINNPIGGMQNAIHRLMQRPDLDERSRTYLLLVQEGLERVGTTARRVLDFSPRQIEAAPFPLQAAVEGAVALVEHRCQREGVELSVQVDSGLPELFGDRHEIQQVLLNLLINALDALAAAPPPRRLRVAAAAEDGWVRIGVEDNGPGASEEVLARAVDPFFSGKSDPSASGLGLFISYSIVESHGGTMQLASGPGGGFTAVIRLPARPPAR